MVGDKAVLGFKPLNFKLQLVLLLVSLLVSLDLGIEPPIVELLDFCHKLVEPLCWAHKVALEPDGHGFDWLIDDLDGGGI